MADMHITVERSVLLLIYGLHEVEGVINIRDVALLIMYQYDALCSLGFNISVGCFTN